MYFLKKLSTPCPKQTLSIKIFQLPCIFKRFMDFTFSKNLMNGLCDGIILNFYSNTKLYTNIIVQTIILISNLSEIKKVLPNFFLSYVISDHSIDWLSLVDNRGHQASIRTYHCLFHGLIVNRPNLKYYYWTTDLGAYSVVVE